MNNLFIFNYFIFVFNIIGNIIFVILFLSLLKYFVHNVNWVNECQFDFVRESIEGFVIWLNVKSICFSCFHSHLLKICKLYSSKQQLTILSTNDISLILSSCSILLLWSFWQNFYLNEINLNVIDCTYL